MINIIPINITGIIPYNRMIWLDAIIDQQRAPKCRLDPMSRPPHTQTSDWVQGPKNEEVHRLIYNPSVPTIMNKNTLR